VLCQLCWQLLLFVCINNEALVLPICWYTSGVMAVVLKIGVGRTALSGHCCSQGAPFTTLSLQCCYWTLARGRPPSCAVLHEAALRPGGLLCCPVVLARNKGVAAIAQQPVRHLSLPGLAVCCPEHKKDRFCVVWILVGLFTANQWHFILPRFRLVWV
jgi:hypothetical protein